MFAGLDEVIFWICWMVSSWREKRVQDERERELWEFGQIYMFPHVHIETDG